MCEISFSARHHQAADGFDFLLLSGLLRSKIEPQHQKKVAASFWSILFLTHFIFPGRKEIFCPGRGRTYVSHSLAQLAANITGSGQVNYHASYSSSCGGGGISDMSDKVKKKVHAASQRHKVIFSSSLPPPLSYCLKVQRTLLGY